MQTAPLTKGVWKPRQISSFSDSNARARCSRNLAVPGQLHAAAAAAMQKLLAERRLQPLDLHRYGRLRPPDELRGTSEAALLGDEDEGAQQIGVESGGTVHGHQHI